MKRTYGLADSIFEEMENESIGKVAQRSISVLRLYAQSIGIPGATHIRGGKLTLLAAIQDRRQERQGEAKKLLGRETPLELRIAGLERRVRLLTAFVLLSREETECSARLSGEYLLAEINDDGPARSSVSQEQARVLNPLRIELDKLEKELEGPL